MPITRYSLQERLQMAKDNTCSPERADAILSEFASIPLSDYYEGATGALKRLAAAISTTYDAVIGLDYGQLVQLIHARYQALHPDWQRRVLTWLAYPFVRARKLAEMQQSDNEAAEWMEVARPKTIQRIPLDKRLRRGRFLSCHFAESTMDTLMPFLDDMSSYEHDYYVELLYDHLADCTQKTFMEVISTSDQWDADKKRKVLYALLVEPFVDTDAS